MQAKCERLFSVREGIMTWFRKKIRVEDFMERIMQDSLPRSIKYYRSENERAPRPMEIKESVLVEAGTGMCLFFLGKYVPEEDKAERQKMSRAFRATQKHVEAFKGAPGNVHTWWKAFTDGLIFHENESRLNIASKVAWDRLLPDVGYREPSPLKAFAHLLEMEIDTAKDFKLV